MNISIIGTGYVGLVSGVCFAKLRNNVICVDIDKKKIDKINNATPPIYEEGLEELLSKYSNRIKATTDYSSSINNTGVTFICVGTPSKEDGGIDLTFIKDVTIEIAKVLREKDNYHLVVVKSTVLPGTSRDVVLPLLEKHSGKKVGKDFGLAMNPEFLREGIAIDDFLKPDRIVIGSYDAKSRDILRKLYKDFSCP
ncbi:MAG: nucleotide sugar dehydrogenase, partial [Candidatus Thermoplasmatota archaeon]|nr:nucleotide sugar dehydrogenase [Candidatus Thermoplasmatota archaeon]